MTKASAYFLDQVRQFLARSPSSKRRELQKLHERIADGKRLSSIAISRHLNLRMAPRIDTTIVYLRFAQMNKIIEADPAGNVLFRYVSEKTTPAPTKNPPGKRP